MNIKTLTIEGYKSIGNIQLEEPNPFTVFVGPNAAGKSNIFEALELFAMCDKMNPYNVLELFGSQEDLFPLWRNNLAIGKIKISTNLGDINPFVEFIKRDLVISFGSREILHGEFKKGTYLENNESYNHFVNFVRVFVGNSAIVKQVLQSDSRLNADCSNLEKVLKRILKDEFIQSEILDVLQLMIPGFKNVEIKSEELSGSDNLLIYENSLPKPINRRLISDGTFNLLSIITAVYQSDKPQFLCIEEPENGLNPKVVRELVNFLRDKCKEKGHYIWLNTHSQTLVSELTPEEIILVDKVDGQTQCKQIKGMDLHGLRMDEALLTNSLGGGIPW